MLSKSDLGFLLHANRDVIFYQLEYFRCIPQILRLIRKMTYSKQTKSAWGRAQKVIFSYLNEKISMCRNDAWLLFSVFVFVCVFRVRRGIGHAKYNQSIKLQQHSQQS